MIGAEQVYSFERARSELEKTKRMLKAFDEKGSFNFMIFVNHLINAMNLVASVLLKRNKVYVAGFETSSAMRDVVEQNSLKADFYETYFFLRSFQNKEVKQFSGGFVVKNWKSSITIKKADLKTFVKGVEEFVKRTEVLIKTTA